MRNFKIERTGVVRDERGMKVGTVQRNTLRDARGSRLAEISGDRIKDSRGLTLGEISGSRIKTRRGNTVMEIDKIQTPQYANYKTNENQKTDKNSQNDEIHQEMQQVANNFYASVNQVSTDEDALIDVSGINISDKETYDTVVEYMGGDKAPLLFLMKQKYKTRFIVL